MNTHPFFSVGVGIARRTYAEKRMEVIDHNDLRDKKTEECENKNREKQIQPGERRF